jgi:translocation and assembly module TamA
MRRFLAAFLAVAFMFGSLSRAADPQPYTVEIDPTGNAELDQALSDSSNLVGLLQSAAVSPFALALRARADVERLLTALKSFGYYQAKVDLRIAGRALDDPDLLEALERAPAEPPAGVRARIELGPLFHLRKIELRGDAPAWLRDKLSLAPGAPALAAEVLEQRERLLSRLLEAGYALAKVEAPDVALIADAQVLDIVYPVQAGAKMNLGKITVQSGERVDEDFLRRRLPLREGQRFDPAAIEKARRDLLSLGAFSSASARPAEHPDAQGRMPIEFVAVERPRHAVSLGASYATDLGGALTVSWRNRNLLGAAERLSLDAGASQLGGNSSVGVGYHASAGFQKPDFLQRGQTLHTGIAAIRQGLIAYDRKAVTLETSLARPFGPHWNGSLGLSLEQSHIDQYRSSADYTLIGLPAALKFDDTDNPYDPARGLRANASLTPMQPLAGALSHGFALAHLTASTYLDLGEPGRSALALRGLVGGALGARAASLPADKRFYAGGGTTVRGYKYQSLGPRFPNDKPRGGVATVAGGVEYRQRIFERYGAAIFLDAGQVSGDEGLFRGRWGMGAGIGARYYSALGPIRLDFALPLNRRSGDGAFEIYLGLGQAF